MFRNAAKLAAVISATAVVSIGVTGVVSAQSSSGSLPGVSVGSSGSLGESDTGSLGIGADAPNMVIKQSGATTRAEFPDRKLLEVCAATRANPAQLMKLGSDPVKAVLDGALGTPINLGGLHINQHADNGVYAIIGACSFKKDISVKMISVPAGVCSVAGVAEFGSTAGSALMEGSLGS